jgi:hypothetical protein
MILIVDVAGISIAATVRGTQDAGVVACAKRKYKINLLDD